MPLSAAEQIVNYVGETVATLGTVPSQEKVIAERFFDEAGGMQTDSSFTLGRAHQPGPGAWRCASVSA